MPVSPSARVHPTAVIDPQAEIGDGVQIGAFVVVEGMVKIGADSIIRPHAALIGPLTMGRGNDVGSFAVLGERPQHLAFSGQEDTRTEIGDCNTFRESVTIHRGTPITGLTSIGNRNYLMVNSHVGHDSKVGDQVMLANGALLAGHCEIHDRAFMSGNAAIHQHARIGRLAFLSGNSGSSRDLLPFMTMAERDQVVGINKVGMQRAGHSLEDINVVRMAYRILFREHLLQRRAIEKLEQELGDHPLIQEIMNFINSSKRGFLGGHHTPASAAYSEAA